jgi:hypothetical protein
MDRENSVVYLVPKMTLMLKRLSIFDAETKA